MLGEVPDIRHKPTPELLWTSHGLAESHLALNVSEGALVMYGGVCLVQSVHADRGAESSEAILMVRGQNKLCSQYAHQ